MSYKINFESYQNNFAIPKSIIDDSFESLDPIYLKVILLIFKNADKSYSSNLLSNLLNVSEGKINKAIQYWIEKQLLIPIETEKVNPSVVLLSKAAQPQNIQQQAIISSKELTYLLECMENLLQRPITSVEHKTIVHILEFIRLPADVVLMALEYCVSIDKVNARYIEKVCANWADNGIVTHELAEQYLNLLKKSKTNQCKVQKIFGIDTRALTDSEREFINRWFDQYGFDLDMIKYAYEKTIASIGKLAFPYINKILLSWHEKGYKTIEEVMGVESEPRKANKKNSQNASYDVDELDRFWDNVPKLK
ncbi:DnaD domain protein [Paludicola sp. MB14-C6]|uniref:DnaD domain protein n=1 Tax=Paludihabitans sp. MB14-C6 TaxID=3070656 RepID=UPI0027DD7A29|nr:DnaD domain protein [Paludicola sp. MB14-C6]WMJ23383.1 DnaD domain protein [Paludicola sp. MB14-C6]